MTNYFYSSNSFFFFSFYSSNSFSYYSLYCLINFNLLRSSSSSSSSGNFSSIFSSILGSSFISIFSSFSSFFFISSYSSSSELMSSFSSFIIFKVSSFLISFSDSDSNDSTPYIFLCLYRFSLSSKSLNASSSDFDENYFSPPFYFLLCLLSFFSIRIFNY